MILANSILRFMRKKLFTGGFFGAARFFVLSRRWLLALVGVILAGLCCAAVLFLPAEQRISQQHQLALRSYQEGRLQEAAGYLRDIPQIISEAEGCELVISIYARIRKLASLERWALSCLKQGSAMPLAAEALAMSFASVGKSGQAIEIIEKIPHPSARIHAALAQLYVYEGDEEKGRRYLLRALKHGNPWSPWLSRVFSARAFYNHPPFLGEVVEVLLSKKTVVWDEERRILDQLRELGMDEQVQLMKQRLDVFSTSE